MKNRLILLLIVICPLLAFSQGNEVPFGNDAYHIVERLAIKSGGAHLSLHRGHKPYSRKDVSEFALRLDTAGIGISGKDRLDLFYIYKDNNEFLTEDPSKAPESDKYILSRKAWFKTFYKTPANFYQLHSPHFNFNANPVIHVKAGYDAEERKFTMLNTRGFRIRGNVDNKVWFSTNLYENQARYQRYIRRNIASNQAVPGAGFFKAYQSNIVKVKDGHDYLNAEGIFGVQASKHIAVEFGHGKHFIGNGHRSMFLSDFGNNYFYLKLNTRVWKIDYQNIFAELITDYPRSGDRLLSKKYMATHHLSFNALPNLNFGVFETVVFDRNNVFELQYLNPIILYRTVEQMVGSPDNVLLGVDYQYTFLKRCSFYGQFLLDEFKFNEVFAGEGWWANKWAGQIGFKYIDVAGVDHLDMQIEYNTARPFIYSHRDSSANYSHYNQTLAHPLGSNFREVIFDLRYMPIKKLLLKSHLVCGIYGDNDPSGINYGASIFEPSTTRNSNYGNSTGQGIGATSFAAYLDASYQIKHNVYVDLQFMLRNKNSELNSLDEKSTHFNVGVRMNIADKVLDF